MDLKPGTLFIAEKPSVAQAIAFAVGGAKRAGTHYECSGGVKVIWCFGHLLEQLKPEEIDPAQAKWALDQLPFIPPKWEKRARSKKDASNRDVRDKEGNIVIDSVIVAQIKAISSLCREASVVVNAGDPDREGNLLVDEVLEYVKCNKKQLRIWLLALDETNVKKALASLRPNEEFAGFTNAAEARGRADYLLGFNFTRGFTEGWRSRNNEGTLHVGRVQTPTLWMVVMRDREIENFKSVAHFTAKFVFVHPNGTFVVEWVPRKGTPSMDEAGRVLDRAVVERLIESLRDARGVVRTVDRKKVDKAPPLPFSLSELQKAANKSFGFTPAETLKIAQSLYETYKMTSYPRSDCQYLPEDQLSDATRIGTAVLKLLGEDAGPLGKCDLNFARKSTAWNDSKVTAHNGIVPTGDGNYASLKPDEQKLYRLIVRNYLAQFASHYLYDSTSVTVEAGADAEMFNATGCKVTQLGWRVLFGATDGEDDDSKGAQKLPEVEVADEGDLTAGKVDDRQTEPPPRYTGASLIDDMENAHKFITDPKIKGILKRSKGIGTDATRAGIIANLVLRGYLTEVGGGRRSRAKGKDKDGAGGEGAASKGKGGGYYISSDKARALIDCLPEPIRRPDLTAVFEDFLSQVEEGDMTLDAFTDRQAKFVARIIDDIKSGAGLANMPSGVSVSKSGALAAAPEGGGQTHACFEAGCGQPLMRKKSRNASRWFWVCGASHFADDKDGIPVARAPKEAPTVTGEHCPDCADGKLLIRKGGRSGQFLGCSNFPKCRYTRDVG